MIFDKLLTLIRVVFTTSVTLFVSTPGLRFRLHFFSLLVVLGKLRAARVTVLSKFGGFGRATGVGVCANFIMFVNDVVVA